MLGEAFSIYLEQHRAVYIDIAKVASSSIKAVLAAELGIENGAGNPHDLSFPRPPASDPAGEHIHPGLFTFAFVRNPWDRLVSCYRDKIAGEVHDFTDFADSGVAHCLARFEVFQADMSFHEFVAAVASILDEESDEHFRSQADFLTNAADDIAVDFVGRFERLESDFAAVVRIIGLSENTRLPRLQAAPQKNYTTYYTAKTRAVVEQRYARDIDLFQYRFTST